jgi:hypothetical protein
MAPLIYGLCALVSIVCAALLLRAYVRQRYRLLLWSGLCFAGLAGNNVLLVLDKLYLPAIDLTVLRLIVALLSVTTLLYGLIWDAD